MGLGGRRLDLRDQWGGFASVKSPLAIALPEAIVPARAGEPVAWRGPLLLLCEVARYLKLAAGDQRFSDELRAWFR